MNWYSRFQPEALANTWFIFASDHGDMVGDHHLWRKTYAYEGSSRIPFIVTPPKHHQVTRQVTDEVIELRDIMPTLLEAAQLAILNTVVCAPPFTLCAPTILL